MRREILHLQAIIYLAYLLHSRGTRERIPISFRMREKSRFFREDCKLAASQAFFRGFGPRFRVHRFKSARPAKNAA